MFLILNALNRDAFADVLDQMFALRARVFGGQPGWDIRVTKGRARDLFDDLNPEYVVGLGAGGDVICALRTLQTTGPHVLSNAHAALHPPQPHLRNATLWEWSHIVVDKAAFGADGAAQVVQAICGLVIAGLDHARRAGMTDIVAIIDPNLNRILKRSNCAPYDYLGIVAPMGKVSAMAALLDCTETRIAKLRAFAGISGDVFLTDAQARALVDGGAQARADLAQKDGGNAEIIAYCAAQLEAARDDQERRAAQRLITHLIDKGLYPAL